jgi:hypothetical protein
MSVPTVRALGRFYGGRLTLVCQTGARELYFSDVPLKRVCAVDTFDETGSRLFDVDRLMSAIHLCDAFISLNAWHSVAVAELLQAITPAVSVGFFPGFTIELPLDFTIHAIDLTFTVVRMLCPRARVEQFAAPIVLPMSVCRAARALRARLPETLRVLAVHTETKPWKSWPTPNFVNLLDEFLEQHGDYVAWVLDYESRAIDHGRHGDRVMPFSGVGLPLAFALISEADAFIGVDSCMLHAADLFRVPGVGLFGNTDAREFGFRFSTSRHVSATGMDGISVARVSAALRSLTRKVPSPSWQHDRRQVRLSSPTPNR